MAAPAVGTRPRWFGVQATVELPSSRTCQTLGRQPPPSGTTISPCPRSIHPPAHKLSTTSTAATIGMTLTAPERTSVP
jgi:hypothetical protein